MNDSPLRIRITGNFLEHGGSGIQTHICFRFMESRWAQGCREGESESEAEVSQV